MTKVRGTARLIFALVGGAFAIGYRFSLIRLLVLAVFFCGGVELLQLPLPTRHARVSDFLVRLCWGLFCNSLCFCRETNLDNGRDFEFPAPVSPEGVPMVEKPISEAQILQYLKPILKAGR